MALRKIQRTPSINYFSFPMPSPKVMVISALAIAAVGFLGYKVVTIRRRLISEDYCTSVLQNLYASQVNIQLGKLEEALEQAKEASVNRKILTGDFDPHDLRILISDLNLFKKNIEPNDIKKLEKIRTHYEYILGSDHILIAVCNYYIAHCYLYLREHLQKTTYLNLAKNSLHTLEKTMQTEDVYRCAVEYYLGLVLKMEKKESGNARLTAALTLARVHSTASVNIIEQELS